MTIVDALAEFLIEHGEHELYVYLRSVYAVYKVHSFNMEPSMWRQGEYLTFYIGNLRSDRYSTRLVVDRDGDYGDHFMRFVRRLERRA